MGRAYGSGGNKKREERREKISISKRHAARIRDFAGRIEREVIMRRTRFLDLALMTVMRFDDDATRNVLAKNCTYTCK